MIKLTKRQCDIISAYAFGNMCAADAAKLLKCHVSTIKFHLDVICEKTGLDPRDFFNLQELFVIAGGEENADEKVAVQELPIPSTEMP